MSKIKELIEKAAYFISDKLSVTVNINIICRIILAVILSGSLCGLLYSMYLAGTDDTMYLFNLIGSLGLVIYCVPSLIVAEAVYGTFFDINSRLMIFSTYFIFLQIISGVILLVCAIACIKTDNTSEGIRFFSDIANGVSGIAFVIGGAAYLFVIRESLPAFFGK
ncbi:MAG: hypothetical protein IJ446_11190 [Oscillospiraceae bacterium]|nr:hypothetical protein [Oscillospiraceae bacterium]